MNFRKNPRFLRQFYLRSNSQGMIFTICLDVKDFDTREIKKSSYHYKYYLRSDFERVSGITKIARKTIRQSEVLYTTSGRNESGFFQNIYILQIGIRPALPWYTELKVRTHDSKTASLILIRFAKI